MELEIVGADELHVNVSMWGQKEGDYTNVMPAYYFKRAKPAR
jgi:hypothetical protein